MADDTELYSAGRANGLGALSQLVLLRAEFRKLREAINELGRGDVEVSNFDELRSALNAELASFANRLDAKWQVLARAIEHFKYDVVLPNDVKVTGIEDLRKTLEMLAELLETKDFAPVIDVKVPDITVPAITVPPIRIPDITVPEARVELDFQPLLDALKPLGFISNKAGKPIAVRLSDGQRFVKQLKEVVRAQERAVQVLTQSSGMTSDEFRQAFGDLTVYGTQTSGFKALTDATAAAQVDSTSKRIYGFELTAIGGLIAVGDSNVRVDAGNQRGAILYPGNLPAKYLTNNLNKLYAAGATGTRLCYVYYS